MSHVGLFAGRPAYMRLDGEPWAQDLDGASPQQPLKVRFALYAVQQASIQGIHCLAQL